MLRSLQLPGTNITILASKLKFRSLACPLITPALFSEQLWSPEDLFYTMYASLLLAARLSLDSA